jgi:2-aminoadipate transaminase
MRRPLPKLSKWASELALTPLQSALAAAASPNVLSFAMGLPDPELFPTLQLAEASAKVLASDGSVLQYSLPCAPLKDKICKYMLSRGVECTPDRVLLTQGAQQALNLLAKLLLDPGSSIIEEEVSYPGFQSLIDAFQPTIYTVPTNAVEGIDVTAVEKILNDGVRPAFIYVMPTGHNPLGVSISLDKRKRLAALAREFQVPLVEDDPYGALSYDVNPMPSIRALEEDWVYYVGSFSKVLGPSLRIGWIVAPSEHIRKLSIIKESSDLDVSTFSQWVVNRYLESERILSHIDDLRTEYRKRRDTMDYALARNMPPSAEWKIPTCGVFFWVDLAKSVNASKFLTACLKEEGVAFLPGEACSRGKRTNGIRLNFSRLGADQIIDGIARIGRVLQRNSMVTPF